MMIVSLTVIIAENPLSVIVTVDNQTFFVEEYFPSIPVKDLVAKYPQIQLVSVYEYGQTFGYVNAFGGIGTNFLVESNKQYEIFVSENVSLVLKD